MWIRGVLNLRLRKNMVRKISKNCLHSRWPPKAIRECRKSLIVVIYLFLLMMNLYFDLMREVENRRNSADTNRRQKLKVINKFDRSYKIFLKGTQDSWLIWINKPQNSRRVTLRNIKCFYKMRIECNWILYWKRNIWGIQIQSH